MLCWRAPSLRADAVSAPLADEDAGVDDDDEDEDEDAPEEVAGVSGLLGMGILSVVQSVDLQSMGLQSMDLQSMRMHAIAR